jgi:hypothetical protein
VYANRRHQPRRVQVFMNWLETTIRPRLISDDLLGAADL